MRQTVNDVYKIGNTGHRVTVLSYAENNNPVIIVDIHDPEGIIIDRVTLKVPVVNGQKPQFNIERTDHVPYEE